MPDTPNQSPLTDEEKDAFDALYHAIGAFVTDPDADRIAMIRGTLDKEALPDEVAVAVVSMDQGDEVAMYPLAIVATPAVFDAITPPEGAMEVRDDE